MPIHRERTPPQLVTKRRARVKELRLNGAMCHEMATELGVSIATIAKDLSILGLSKKIRKRGTIPALRERIPEMKLRGMERREIADELGLPFSDDALVTPRKIFSGNIAALKAIAALDMLPKAHWSGIDPEVALEIIEAGEIAITTIRKILRFL